MTEHHASTAAISVECTPGLPTWLRTQGGSLLLTTAQCDRVITLAANEQGLRVTSIPLAEPTGCARHGDELTIGGAGGIWQFRRMARAWTHAATRGQHDAAWLAARRVLTGEIDVHEIAYDNAGELWLVNTRFSCLCTLDRDHSFVPRWQPPFISALMPEDRCHLNGLALVDGTPRFVTALGETDARLAWHANRRTGGVVIDVSRQAVVARGLCMPHSPRWHEGALWLVEGGRGTLGRLDLEHGTVETVAELPGFTRGLQLVGRHAIVGLSTVRDHSAFGGLPVTQRYTADERLCGVIILDRHTGETVGQVTFTEGVSEIFDVMLLPETTSPTVLAPDDPRVSQAFILPKR